MPSLHADAEDVAFNLRIFGYDVRGDVLERAALHSEARTGADLREADWDHDAAWLRLCRRWNEGMKAYVQVPESWCLPWLAEAHVRGCITAEELLGYT